MKRNHAKRADGFTILELLVVVVIIVILVSVGFGLAGYVRDLGARTLTETTLRNIALVEEQYYQLTGQHHRGSTSPFMQDVTAAPEFKPMLREFSELVLQQNKEYTVGSSDRNYRLFDGWGVRIFYQALPGGNTYSYIPAAVGEPFFVSAGPDNKFGDSRVTDYKQPKYVYYTDNMYSHQYN